MARLEAVTTCWREESIGRLRGRIRRNPAQAAEVKTARAIRQGQGNARSAGPNDSEAFVSSGFDFPSSVADLWDNQNGRPPTNWGIGPASSWRNVNRYENSSLSRPATWGGRGACLMKMRCLFC